MDNKLTKEIQDWINTPAAERDVRKGAELLLSLNRNRAMYNSFLLRPDRYMNNVVYELRKFLKIRLDKMTSRSVAALEQRVMTKAAVISTSDEMPAATTARGKRPDHDRLPLHIRRLWDDNVERIKKIALLFNELKAMNHLQPCDRYEKLKLLDEADTRYREDMEQYDNFDPASYIEQEEPEEEEPAADNVMTARKSLSRLLKRIASVDQDSLKYPELVEEIRARVKVIIDSGGKFSSKISEQLEKLNITCHPE